MRHDSLHDALTGLGNRRAFDAFLEETLAWHHKYGDALSLALLDLDGFKAANDRYGHAAGDEVLKEVAAILRHTIRPSDRCFRIGGDEFAILFPGTVDLGARLAIERCTDRVNDANLAEGIVGISAGVIEAGAQNAVELVAEADGALYKEKERKGRRSVR